MVSTYKENKLQISKHKEKKYLTLKGMSVYPILPETNFQTKDFIYLRRPIHFSGFGKYIPSKSLPSHTEKN